MDTNNTVNVLKRGIWIARDAVYEVRKMPKLAYIRISQTKIILTVATWINGKYVSREFITDKDSRSHVRLRKIVRALGYRKHGRYVSFSVPGLAVSRSGKVKRFYIMPEAEVTE